MGQILDGRKLSKQIKEEIGNQVKSCMIKPSLAFIQIGHETCSSYRKQLEQTASEVGMNFRLFSYDNDASEREIINRIVELNNDEYIDGILVELPIPKPMNASKIINMIDVKKDVDGLTMKNIARFYNQRKGFIPCVSMAVMYILKANQIELVGKHVVIVGRGSTSGKILANLLLQEDATVTMAHSKTENLKSITKMADILIVATGKKGLIQKDMVKEGVTIIDIGNSKEGKEIFGDVEPDVFSRTSYFTPVPGGVGLVTVAMVLKNVMECYNNKIASK